MAEEGGQKFSFNFFQPEPRADHGRHNSSSESSGELDPSEEARATAAAEAEADAILYGGAAGAGAGEGVDWGCLQGAEELELWADASRGAEAGAAITLCLSHLLAAPSAGGRLPAAGHGLTGLAAGRLALPRNGASGGVPSLLRVSNRTRAGVQVRRRARACFVKTLPPAPQEAGAAQTEVEVPGTDIRLLKCAVSSEAAAALLGEGQVAQSDLVPGKYEGGFKLWEGALDLAAHLAREHSLTSDRVSGAHPAEEVGLQDMRVLELGCGHGLPGILCLLAGAEVHFQDYNKEVLTTLTAPNVAANLKRTLPRGATRRAVRYFSGDWLAVGSLLSSKGLDAGYDLVLSSETIYSLHGASRLLECIKQVLRPPHGIALVAAKSHYFGVGGGTAGFAAAVRADGTLECERVWVVEDGASNKREILKLSFPAAIVPYFM